MSRLFALLYGFGCYLFFFAVFLWFIVFVGDFVIPGVVAKTISHGAPAGGIGAAAWDIALLSLFGLQHSVMARAGFKAWWTRIVPSHVERSTYVLASAVVLAFAMWQWQPVAGVVWQVEAASASYLLWGAFGFGWALIFLATFLTDHFDLFGLRQVYLNFVRKTYTHVPFRTLFVYRYVRHPMMLGLLIAFWSVPTMTLGHLVFSVVFSLYVLIGVHFEERGLLKVMGPEYLNWRARTPMLVPFGRGSAGAQASGERSAR